MCLKLWFKRLNETGCIAKVYNKKKITTPFFDETSKRQLYTSSQKVQNKKRKKLVFGGFLSSCARQRTRVECVKKNPSRQCVRNFPMRISSVKRHTFRVRWGLPKTVDETRVYPFRCGGWHTIVIKWMILWNIRANSQVLYCNWYIDFTSVINMKKSAHFLYKDGNFLII